MASRGRIYMKRKQQTEKMVRYSLYTALILIFSLTPNIGYITIGPYITITTVPIIVSIIIIKEWTFEASVFSGVMFGIGSWIASFMFPGGLGILFQNPLLSVLPRIAAIITAFLIVKHIANNVSKNIITISIVTGALVAGLNSTYVFLSWNTITKSALESFIGLNAMDFIIKFVIVSSVGEFISTAIIVPMIAFKLRSNLEIKNIKESDNPIRK